MTDEEITVLVRLETAQRAVQSALSHARAARLPSAGPLSGLLVRLGRIMRELQQADRAA